MSGLNGTKGPLGSPLLEIEGVSKSFAGTPVLRDVSFAVCSGEFHALLGENGAGKSTLIKIISGTYRADSGTVKVAHSAGRADGRASVAFVHQDLALVPTMTVAENIGHGVGFVSRKGLISWKRVSAQAVDALEAVGLKVAPDQEVRRLSRGEQALVAIARAVAVQASVIVLDEPTATLAVADVDRLFELLRTVQTTGCGILYVTHRLDEVFRVADTVTVLRDGLKVSTRKVAETSLEMLSTEIVGRPLSAVFPERPEASQSATMPVLFEVKGLVCKEVESGRTVGPVNLEVRQGEVVGVAGLRGAGQELVARAVRDPSLRVQGQVRAHGGSSRSSATRSQRVAVVPSDRKAEGIFEGLTLRENLFPASQTWKPEGSRSGLVSQRKEHKAAFSLLGSFRVVPREPERLIETLSGGNQQKVVLARAVTDGTEVLMLEEPTAGVDVGARAEIYRLVREAALAGRAILVISSDFEEVAGLCDRVYVCRAGIFVHEVPGLATSRDELARLAVGAEVEVL